MSEVQEVTAVEVVGDEPDLPVEQPRVFSVSELRTQVDVANAYPRNVGLAVADLRSLALASEDAAGSMFYALKRGGKTLNGASIRFAETLVYCWGNIRVYGREVEQTHSEVVCEGYAWDIQKNSAIARQVRRRIVDKDGNRYSGDMVNVTSNAGISVGIRNAVLSVVPRSIWQPVYEEAKDLALGADVPIEKLRARAIAWWEKMEREVPELLAYLGVTDTESIERGHLHLLRGLRTGVNDGSLSLAYEIDRVLSRREDSPEETKAFGDALKVAASEPDLFDGGA